ncbi:hypothetical protein ACHAPJ_006605 [Fusarium lateritium]
MNSSTVTLPPPNYPPEITGYVEPWIASPGDKVAVKVSSTEQDLDYKVVRLIHGPQGEDFNGMTQETVTDIPGGTFAGRYQVANPGSYAIIDPRDYGFSQDGVDVTIHFQAHLVEEATHVQTIISTLDVPSSRGFAAVLTDQGYAELWIGTGSSIQVVPTGFKPALKEWTALNFTIQSDKVNFKLTPIASISEKTTSPVAGSKALTNKASMQGDCVLAIAASYAESADKSCEKPVNFFNGRISGPELRSATPEAPVIAKWDFSLQMDGDIIVDVSKAGANGRLVNAPTRAVSGHDWDGTESDWTKTDRGYNAVHFHEDDLDDAAFETDLSLVLPQTLRSGAYAVVIRATGSVLQDSIPFFVRPTESTTAALGAKVAYVLSTFTYLAYANEHVYDRDHLMSGADYNWNVRRDDHVSKTERRLDLGLSCYDVHNDRSGVIHSSAKRPILNLRPDYLSWNFHRPRGLGADLLGLEFLEKSGIPYDVVTDEELHVRGKDAFQPYQTVVTASHPEYHTVESLFAYIDFVKAGGNLMYLGGNGFYWSCATKSGKLHRVEIRRGDQGCRSFTLPGGDRVFSTNGQLGLLWRSRGLAANKLVGVGCCAVGQGPGVPYKRTEASRDQNLAWMFKDIQDELIGTEGFGGGASGDELDKCNFILGSPSNTIVVATTQGHPDEFGLFPEDADFPMTKTVGTQTNEIRSDMTYYESGGGGAVFSIGSINWLCSLGWNHFQNNVAKLTENVLREFVRRHK